MQSGTNLPEGFSSDYHDDHGKVKSSTRACFIGLKKRRRIFYLQNRFIRKQNTRKKKTRGDINLETLTGVKILDLSFVKEQVSDSFFFPIACQ